MAGSGHPASTCGSWLVLSLTFVVVLTSPPRPAATHDQTVQGESGSQGKGMVGVLSGLHGGEGWGDSRLRLPSVMVMAGCWVNDGVTQKKV